MMKQGSSIAVVVILAAIWGGCSSSSSKSAAPAPEKSAAMAKESGGFYAEESYKGRLYVFGTEKAHQAFKDTQQVPHIAKTYIGVGPDGQSVVLEADAKTTDLQDRLKSDYEGRHNTKLP
jgi:hypothetical protein